MDASDAEGMLTRYREGAEVIPLRAPRSPCPLCGAPATRANRPFCSRRCADLDLGKWLNGSYRIETDEAPPDREDGE